MEFLRIGTISDEAKIEERTNEMIANTIELIRTLKYDMKSTLERVHFHATNIQMICSTEEWEDSRFALARSVMVGLM